MFAATTGSPFSLRYFTVWWARRQNQESTMMGRLELLMVAIATTLLASVTTAFAPTPLLLLSSSGGSSTTMPLSVLVGTGTFSIAGWLFACSFSFLVLALPDTS
jgi:hypothetical protein